MYNSETGREFTEICLCKDSSGRSGFLLGVNTFDLRWGQYSGLCRLSRSLWSLGCSQQRVVATQSVAVSSLVALAPQKIISSGSAGGRHLAVWPVAPGGTRVVL